VRGYKEEGTTTTPLTWSCRTTSDRFHLVMERSFDRVPKLGQARRISNRLFAKLVEHKRYIEKHGQDLPEIRAWKWEPPSRSVTRTAGKALKRKTAAGALMSSRKQLKGPRSGLGWCSCSTSIIRCSTTTGWSKISAPTCVQESARKNANVTGNR